MPETDLRETILSILKRERAASIVPLADRLGVTYEAIRQHLIQLESEGLVARRVRRPVDGVAGRPPATYSLTAAGDHLFPKQYDALATALIDAVEARVGEHALRTVLGAITDSAVNTWLPRLRGRMLERRLDALREYYTSDDPFMHVETDDDGLALVERNCPFLNVAMRSPQICSTTVTALSRLLGYRVVRTERFQDGDRRCVFRVLLDETVDVDARGFQQEPDPPR